MPMNNKLKSIIYNARPRDEASMGVMDRGAVMKSRQCEYVLGGSDQADWFYCGQPTHERSVYCAEHHALCYTRGRRRVSHA